MWRAFAFPIPDSLTDNEASFMEPLACCVRAVKRAGIQPSDVVVVVGVGSIGLLFMQLIRHAGGKCIGLDLDPARRELADSLGSIRNICRLRTRFRRIARLDDERSWR